LGFGDGVAVPLLKSSVRRLDTALTHGSSQRVLKRQFRDVLRRAVRLARAEHKEVCGLLVDNGFFLQMLEVRNVSRRPGSFVLSLSDARKLERAASLVGNKVVGSFHSHVLGLAKPGKTDIHGSHDGEIMLIIDTLDRKARLWRIKNGRARELRLEFL
jgi:proteasome lid subunit RPN8/RPN11